MKQINFQMSKFIVVEDAKLLLVCYPGCSTVIISGNQKGGITGLTTLSSQVPFVSAKITKEPIAAKEVSWKTMYTSATAKQLILAARSTHQPQTPGDPTSISALSAFGRKLGALRRKGRLTFDELAKKTGLDTDLLIAIELGVASIGEVLSSIDAIEGILSPSEHVLSKYLLRLIEEELEIEICT